MVQDLRKTHVVEMAQSLALLTANKDQQRRQAVQKAHEFEQKVTKDVLLELREKCEAEIALVSAKVNDNVFEIDRVTRQMDELDKEKARLVEFLKTTRFWFQDFIDRVQQVRKGHADFMLPPAYIEEIERGLMLAE